MSKDWLSKDWLEEAKDNARIEAKEFIDNMTFIANQYAIVPDWFIDEVLSNIRKMRGGKE